MSKIHKLKISPVHFIGVMNGTKTAEFRVNDRNFRPGCGDCYPGSCDFADVHHVILTGNRL